LSKSLEFSFVASLPAIQSAIKIDGNGDGARIQMEVPGSELEAIIKLQILCGKAFRVTIKEIDNEKIKESKGIKFIR